MTKKRKFLYDDSNLAAGIRRYSSEFFGNGYTVSVSWSIAHKSNNQNWTLETLQNPKELIWTNFHHSTATDTEEWKVLP